MNYLPEKAQCFGPLEDDGWLRGERSRDFGPFDTEREEDPDLHRASCRDWMRWFPKQFGPVPPHGVRESRIPRPRKLRARIQHPE